MNILGGVILLKLNKDVQRFLISSTSKLTGYYEDDSLLISKAYQADNSSARESENHFSRSYYIISFHTPNMLDEKDIIIPDISSEFFLVALSVLYGKRFDEHGAIEKFGYHQVPVLPVESPINEYKIGFNNHQKRANLAIDLDLKYFEKISPLFNPSIVDEKVKSIFLAAGSFYLHSIQRYETHPDSAYLDLITCGEILSNFYNYEEKELYDLDLLNIFQKISLLPDGEKDLKNLKKRFAQISKKFKLTLLDLLTEDFYMNNEVNDPHNYNFKDTILTYEKRKKNITNAYNLRSKYVHTGRSFSKILNMLDWEHMPDNITLPQIVNPSKEQKEFLNSIKNAPTYKGLERMLRFCLLKFLEKNSDLNFSDI